MVLPVLTLAVGEAAYILRTTRGAMRGDARDAVHRCSCARKGLSPSAPSSSEHALRNAARADRHGESASSSACCWVARSSSRRLFALPGVGRLVVTAINQRNYTVVQGGILVVATLFILVNLLTDVIVGLVDPRVEDGQTS